MSFLISTIYVILSFIVALLLFLLSISAFNASAAFAYLQEIITSDPSTRIIVGAISVILAALPILYIRKVLCRSRRSKSIDFESPEGKVSITLFAIEDMLKKILEEKTEVANIKPKIRLKKKGMEVIARGVLTREVNLVEFTKEIQEIVKEKIHTLIGQDKNVHVSLEIRKVAFGNKKELIIEEKEPEIPFRNYD